MNKSTPKMLNSFAVTLTRLPRKFKRLLMLSGDIIMVPAALWTSIALRYGFMDSELAAQVWMYPLVIALFIPVFVHFGLYRAVVRFMGTKVVLAVVYGVVLSTLAFAVASYTLLELKPPLTVLIIFGLLCLLYVGGSRFAVRMFLQRQRAVGDLVAIYGAGDAGAYLASALASSQKYSPVAFLDDNISLHGSVINGIEVFAPSRLSELIESLEITRVLLAVPSASRRRRRRIIELLEQYSVHVQTMPDMADLVSGVTRVDEIREVDVADLLGRDAVPPDESLLGACIRGKVVLATGAGGSIGSELCRQIIRQDPRMLLLIESNELALYNVHKELAQAIERDKLNVELVPLLGSAHHQLRMAEIMRTFGVQTVYHAAAYKHVPMVESNVVEGIYNNVYGTLHSAEAAIETGVETFVLVSTDKAVCPTNVMGASKRMAEMVLQSLDERGSSTRFCMVRFGNVLASSGSVVPLFREQIQRGGPVTVTHPEIIRFFMTIPEAAQLVIQAGSMGKGGDVFLLDMGKPVRIKDLARRMVHLMGLTVMDDENPEGDIEIKYTGLRPAEKLYEELIIGNNVMGTEHPMIMRAEEQLLPWSELKPMLDEMQRSIISLDSMKALEILKTVVVEYTPSKEVVDLVWLEKQSILSADGKVEKIPSSVTDISSKRSSS